LLSFGDNEEENGEEDGGDAPALPTRMVSLAEVMEQTKKEKSGESSRKKRKLNDEGNKTTEAETRSDAVIETRTAEQEHDDEEDEVDRKRPTPPKRPAPVDSDSDDDDSDSERGSKKKNVVKTAPPKQLKLSGALTNKAAFLEQRKASLALSKEEKERLALQKLQKFQSGMRGSTATVKKDDWRSQPLRFEKEDEQAFKKRLAEEADTLVVIDEREEEMRSNRGGHPDRDFMNDHERGLRQQKNLDKW
jgi:hypothetical protein